VIVVRNMPGGAASMGGNYVAVSRPDGLTALIGSSNTATGSLLQTRGVKYSYEKMPVWAVASVAEVMVGWTDITKSFKDFLKRDDLIFGMEPLPNPSTATWIILKEACGFKSKDVLAFQGGADRALAWYQKETNLTWLTSPQYSQSAKSDVEKGKAAKIMQSGLLNKKGEMVRSEYFKDVPTTGEVWKDLTGKDPSGIEWEAVLALLGYARTCNKPALLPEGTPDNIVQIYRTAAEKMLQDPEYQKAAHKIYGGDPQYAGAEARDILNFANNFAAKTRPWLRDFMTKKGGVRF
jgi:hypothetical protein